MADLDRDLSSRLSRLAESVPVGRGQLDPVHTGAVSARQSVRLAWATPLVALIVVALAAGLAKTSPAAPASSPVVSAVRDGPFELTLTSNRSQYLLGEAIDVKASLTFHGPGGTVTIAHGHGSPVAFGVVERVGKVFLVPAWRQSCELSALEREVPLVRPFAKSGSFSGDNPAASDAAGFFEDPVLVLPAGIWHLYVVADFGVGDCGIDRHLLRTDIEITVADAPGPSADRSKSSISEGDFELSLAAAKGTFSSDEPLDVIASLTYLGPDEHIVIHHLTWGPLEFGMWAPGVTLNPRGRWTCSDLEMTRGVPITEALGDLGNGGTQFAVPHGLREITASAQFSRGSCDAPPDAMETSIIVAVADGPDDIPLMTDEASQVTVCLLVRNGGRLTPTTTGLGVVSFDGKLRDVVWPIGYSARRTVNGAVLFDRDGQAVAHEGEDVAFDALTPDQGPVWPCGEVARRGSSATMVPTPAPAPSVAPGDSPRAHAEEDNGTLGIRVLTPRASVHEGDPITVFTTFGYVGTEPKVVLHHFGPPIAFQLDQIDAAAPQALGVMTDYATCTDTVLGAGAYADAALGPLTRVTGDGVSGNWIGEHFDGSKLRLPVGTWRITAAIVGSTQGCEVADSGSAVQTWIEVTVGPVEAGGISLLTDPSPPTSSDSCPGNTAAGALAIDPVSGLGLEDANGKVEPVRWPFDVSAEHGPDGALLYDSLGFRWA
ncbi:MAG TPA: hypothetical protein VMY34_03615, partial [Acidimicrobiales bacterium]|nr:hypothetical protein [Acidimicrobiales bacterium]